MGTAALEVYQSAQKDFLPNLLTSGELNCYLIDIDKHAEDIFSRLVKKMAKQQVVTE